MRTPIGSTANSSPHRRVESTSMTAIVCSQGSGHTASFWSRTVQLLLAIAAIEVGVWAGLELSPHPTSNTISIVHRVGGLPPAGLKGIEAEASLPSDYVQIGTIISDGKSFCVFLEASQAPSGTDGLRRWFCKRF